MTNQLTIINSTYVGPDANLRTDRDFQKTRAESDLRLARAMARDGGRSRAAAHNRRVGSASIPVILARLAALKLS